jgi:RimJ/RimL family protein N-acetyltransferase
VATTASRALTDAAFAIDGIERVRITCAEDNVRSARVPEKLGYRFLGVQVPDDGPHEGRSTQHWEVERAAWSRRPSTA